MKLEEYKESIRKYRGHLASMDEELGTIYFNGSELFKEMSLSTKVMGISKMANIAEEMDWGEQNKFVVWLLEKKRNKSEIDTKLLELV